MIHPDAFDTKEYIIINDDNEVVVTDYNGYLSWVTINKCVTKQLAFTEVLIGITVSTIFMGGPKFGNILGSRCFESLVNDRMDLDVVSKYRSYESAMRGHDKLVAEVRLRNLDD